MGLGRNEGESIVERQKKQCKQRPVGKKMQCPPFREHLGVRVEQHGREEVCVASWLRSGLQGPCPKRVWPQDSHLRKIIQKWQEWLVLG